MSTKTAIELNNEGMDLYLAKKFPEAIEKFLKAIEMDKTNPIFYKNLGDSYYDNGNVKDALNYYKTAVKMDEKNPAFLLDYAMILHNENQDRLALTQLTLAMEIEPQNPDVLYQLAVTYYALKENQSAISTAQRLLKIQPKNQEILLILLKCYFSLQNIPLIDQTLGYILSINPNNVKALFLASQIYQKLNNPVNAAKYITQTYHFDKQNAAYVESMYEFYEQAFLYGRLYPIVQKFRENNFIFDSYLGKRFQPPVELLDYFVMGVEFREALYAETQDYTYKLNAEDSSKLLENIENFLSRVENEATIDLEQNPSKLLSALSLYTKKKFHEAFEIIGEMFGKMSSELYYFLLAIDWTMMENFESACKSWNIFLKNEKQDAPILLFYAYSLYKLKKSESAKEMLIKSYELKPEWQVYFPNVEFFDNSFIIDDLFGISVSKILLYLKTANDS